jgi:hypothetical protein
MWSSVPSSWSSCVIIFSFILSYQHLAIFCRCFLCSICQIQGYTPGSLFCFVLTLYCIGSGLRLKIQNRSQHSVVSPGKISMSGWSSIKYFSPEPIGGIGPKFSTSSEIQAFTFSQSSDLALLCPAQGYDVPIARLGYSVFEYLLS